MEIFKNGSKYVRFDCHLHTKSDKEFKIIISEIEKRILQLKTGLM